MKIDASGKVKDPLGRGGDESRQVNRWHFLINRCWIDWIVPFSTEKIIPKPNLVMRPAGEDRLRPEFTGVGNGSAKRELDHFSLKELIPHLDPNLAVNRSKHRTHIPHSDRLSETGALG